MAYTHLTMNELGWIETYHDIGLSASHIARKLDRSKHPICNVINCLQEGQTIQDYYARYKANKKKCGSKKKTLVERVSKVIITLKPQGRKARVIEQKLTQWFKDIPRHLFKSMTFDCGKEFSNWKSLSNQHDVSIFFADPGCPSQRGLNEHSNGLLRRDGLPKQMDFNQVDQPFISSVADHRNHIPRKSLNYKTPWEVFHEHVPHWKPSSLI